MSERNRAIIQNVNDAFARSDVEALLSHCADDFEWAMVGDKPIKGKDAIRRFMAQGPAEPPQFTVATVIADGDYVTAIGDMTMNENGTVVPYAYCDVWRFQGDRLVELKAFVIKTERAAATT